MATHSSILAWRISWTEEPGRLQSMESVIPSNHLSLCCPLCLLPSIFPSIRVFYNQSVLPIKWPKYWSFSFSISPSNEYSGSISFRIDWFDVLAVQESSSTPQFESISSLVLSLLYGSTLTSIHDYWKNHSPPGSPVHEILQARILEWVALPSSRRSS